MVAAGHAPASAVVGATIATTLLAGICVIFRLFTRFAIVKKAGLDDACITLAFILSIALTVTMCEQVKYGMGRHASTLTANDTYQSLKWFWASVWIYYPSLCLTKLSILLQYLRVFPGTRTRIACFILMGVVIAYSLGTFFSAIFACTPVAFFWDKALKGTCINLKAMWFSNASINIVTDICTAVLPLPTLYSLNLPKRQKYALMAVFALGGFTCIISILRLQSLYVVSNTKDITWNNPLAAIWSSAETNVGIVCSCLPTLKGCIQRVFPRFFSSTNSRDSLSNRSRYQSGFSGRSAPPRSRISFNAMDHELSGRKYSESKNQIYTGCESEGTPSTPQWEFPNNRHIAIHTTVAQDVERKDVEIASGDSDSLRRVDPNNMSFYQAV